MKTFTLDQMLEVLTSMAQGIDPRNFESSKDLDTTDFLDLPLCKAKQLGIETEFRESLKNNSNYKAEEY